MSKRRRRSPPSLGAMLVDLTAASWETIGRRSMMMASGTCSPAEYLRMTQEKLDAFNRSASLLTKSRGRAPMTALLAPWHAKAAANARRLRGKRR